MTRRQRLHTLLSALLVFICLLNVGAAGSCNSSPSDREKLSRGINALIAAEALPPVLGLPEREGTCATEAFKGVRVALEHLRDNPNATAAGAALTAIQNLNIGNCTNNTRAAAIAEVTKRIVLAALPTNAGSATAAAAAVRSQTAQDARDQPPPTVDFSKVSEDDLRELERLVKVGK